MKKIIALLISLTLVFACVGCGSKEEAAAQDTKSEGVMTYEEYVAAELDSEVVVET